MDKNTVIYLIVWNIIVCVIYYFDKVAAIKGTRRVPEKSLIGFAFLFGGIGAYLGMKLFHHKTKHTKFMILVPVFAIVQVILIYSMIRTS